MIDPVALRDSCRLCGGKRLSLALRLEPTPLGDHFVARDRLELAQPSFPLDLLLCADCGNVQLQQVVDPEMVYKEYTYTSSVSLGLAEHFQRYADDALRRVNLPPEALVVEIGSNEGAMLRAFQQRGLRVMGVDPARNIAARAAVAGIQTLPAYFTAELAATIRSRHGAASLLIANNVLANIDDLGDVARGIRALLAPDGLLMFETSYCLDVVQAALLDTIFHEHLSYFAVRPLAAFFRRHDLEMIDAQPVPTKGGSWRGVVQLAHGPRPVARGVAELSAREAEFGLDRLEPFQATSDRLQQRKAELMERVRRWKSQGRSIAAYGAAVGLTTMIYHFGLGEYLDFIADDNPFKHGLLSPGLHLPTLPSAALYQHKPDFVIVLAWRYFDAIARKHRAYLDQGGQFVLPMPEVRVVGGRQG